MNAKPTNQSAGLYSVACPRAGDCVAGGAYESTQGGDAMVVTESSGRWRQATEVTLPSNAQSQPYAEVNGVACAAVGSCVAVGYYSYEFPDVDNAFLVTETHGTWGSATMCSFPLTRQALFKPACNGWHAHALGSVSPPAGTSTNPGTFRPWS
jgi:hypothetical protein